MPRTRITRHGNIYSQNVESGPQLKCSSWKSEDTGFLGIRKEQRGQTWTLGQPIDIITNLVVSGSYIIAW